MARQGTAPTDGGGGLYCQATMCKKTEKVGRSYSIYWGCVLVAIMTRFLIVREYSNIMHTELALYPRKVTIVGRPSSAMVHSAGYLTDRVIIYPDQYP